MPKARTVQIAPQYPTYNEGGPPSNWRQPQTAPTVFTRKKPSSGMLDLDENDNPMLSPFTPEAAPTYTPNLPVHSVAPIVREPNSITDAIARRLEKIPDYVYNTDRNTTMPTSRDKMMEQAIARRTSSGSRLPTPSFNGGKSAI